MGDRPGKNVRSRHRKCEICGKHEIQAGSVQPSISQQVQPSSEGENKNIKKLHEDLEQNSCLLSV